QHLALRRDPVQRALRQYLVERHAVELRRAHRAHQIVQPGEARQGGFIVDVDLLPAPPHPHIRTYVLRICKRASRWMSSCAKRSVSKPSCESGVSIRARSALLNQRQEAS